jgi:hypothetical protein
MLFFRLGRRAKVELVVRGPSPSCAVAGKQLVRGHRGLNRVHFSGRLRGHRLAPGVYTIAVVAVRGGARRRVGTIGIEIVSPQRRLSTAERSASVGAFCASRPSASLASLVLPLGGTARGGLATGSARDRKPRDTGVLGAEILPRISLPHASLPNGRLGTVLAATIFGLIGLAAATLLVYVTRFLRGTWNP